MSDRLLSRKELAAALGRSRHYVHRMQQAGFAPAFAGRFTLADARAWLTAHPDFRATGKKITKRQKATRSDKKQHAPLHCPAPRELHPIRHAHDYVDFDYDAVEEAEGAAQQPDGGENFASLAHGLGEFCHMLTMPDLSAGTPHPKPPDARTVGLRTIAALWFSSLTRSTASPCTNCRSALAARTRSFPATPASFATALASRHEADAARRREA